MTKQPATIIGDYARREFIFSLAMVEHAGGKDVALTLVEAHLDAIRIYLTGSVGKERAYEILQTQADDVLEPAIMKRRLVR